MISTFQLVALAPVVTSTFSVVPSGKIRVTYEAPSSFLIARAKTTTTSVLSVVLIVIFAVSPERSRGSVASSSGRRGSFSNVKVVLYVGTPSISVAVGSMIITFAGKNIPSP